MKLSTRITFIYLALHALADLVLAIIVYHQTGEAVIGFAVMLVFCAFILLSYFGIKNEGFRGRHGRRVLLWREPAAYWFCFAFLALFHLIVTILVVKAIPR